MHLSGRENLRIVAAVRGVPRRVRASSRRSPASGSPSAPPRRSRSYSMGMRQRLGVARCLLADPLLLILDEPTNGLDPGGIQEFREMIRAMVEQEGRTVFISSHLLDEVEKTCDAAAIVDRGKVVTQGAMAELASGGEARHELILGVDDAERALAALDGSELVIDARRSDEGLRVALAGGPQTAAQLNAMLVAAGIGVMRLEPVRQSLEQRFLEITSRLDAPTDPQEVRHERHDRCTDGRGGLPQAAQEAWDADLGVGAGAGAADHLLHRRRRAALLQLRAHIRLPGDCRASRTGCASWRCSSDRWPRS